MSVQTRDRGVPRPRERGRRMSPFLGRKLRDAFGQPVFFLVGNCMTIPTCEKDVSLKA